MGKKTKAQMWQTSTHFKLNLLLIIAAIKWIHKIPQRGEKSKEKRVQANLNLFNWI